MKTKRQIEIFSAGCAVCEQTIALVRQLTCASCQVTVLDTQQAAVAARAKKLGVRSIPAVLINGQLADCCSGRGPNEQSLRAAGLGQAL